jgi:hypothetical protein
MPALTRVALTRRRLTRTDDLRIALIESPSAAQARSTSVAVLASRLVTGRSVAAGSRRRAAPDDATCPRRFAEQHLQHFALYAATQAILGVSVNRCKSLRCPEPGVQRIPSALTASEVADRGACDLSSPRRGA